MSEAVTFWQGIGKLPEEAQKSFWDAGVYLSNFIGERPQPIRLQLDTSKPPAGAPWWEVLLFYIGQGQYNQAVAHAQAGPTAIEGAGWLWGALQGDFNKNPTTGQIVVGGLISMIPLVDQACDVRDVVANCLVLHDEKERENTENWMALGLTCIGFVPEFGSAVKTVAKVAFKDGTRLLPLLKHMEWIEKNFKALKVACPWGYAPIEWLRKFDWIGTARRAAEGAKKAFDKALKTAEAALKYVVGAIKTKLQELVSLFKTIAAKIGDVMADLGRRIKARIDEMLGTAKKDAGHYEATPGNKPNTHVQSDAEPPKGPPPGKPPRMEPHKPKCFKPGDDLSKNWKGDPKKLEKEFYEQLKAQEEGINKLSVKEYLENRAKFEQTGRGTGVAQATARANLLDQITGSVMESLRRDGLGATEAKRQATQRAGEIMSSLAALHDPDMIAGGHDKIGGFGDRKVNSSIGSQWAKEGRVAEMDRAAEEAFKKHGADAKMNVNLERCK